MKTDEKNEDLGGMIEAELESSGKWESLHGSSGLAASGDRETKRAEGDAGGWVLLDVGHMIKGGRQMGHPKSFFSHPHSPEHSKLRLGERRLFSVWFKDEMITKSDENVWQLIAKCHCNLDTLWFLQQVLIRHVNAKSPLHLMWHPRETLRSVVYFFSWDHKSPQKVLVGLLHVQVRVISYIFLFKGIFT